MSGAFPIRLPLPRPENNWLCPRRAPLELNVICKAYNCSKRQWLLFVFLRLATFNAAQSHSCSPAPQTFVSRAPSRGLSDYIFYCIETKSHLELLVSTVSGLPFPGSPARPPMKRHPPPALSLYFSPPASTPPQLLCLCPSAPLTLSLGDGYLVLAEQCGLSACIKHVGGGDGGKRHNFKRLNTYRFFTWFHEPGVSLLVTNIFILGHSWSSFPFFLAPNLSSA